MPRGRRPNRTAYNGTWAGRRSGRTGRRAPPQQGRRPPGSPLTRHSQELADRGVELGKTGPDCCRGGAKEIGAAGLEPRAVPVDRCPEAAADMVAHDGRADLSPHGIGQARWDGLVAGHEGQRDGPPATPRTRYQSRERGPVSDPPGVTQIPLGQAVSRARPFSRRALTTARPARVRIRARNPCVRMRLRFLGWKVRFTHDLLGERPKGLPPDRRGHEQDGGRPGGLQCSGRPGRSRKVPDKTA